jgi:hypothetical protein
VLAGVDAGTLLYSAMGQLDPAVDMMVKLMAEFRKSDAAAEEHHLQKEAEVEEHRLKAEKWSQHMKLLEMLHEGKIFKEMYELMKP